MIETDGFAVEPVAPDPELRSAGSRLLVHDRASGRVDFPEVAVFGLTPVAANGLIGLVADALRGGTEIPLGVELVGLLDNDLRCAFASSTSTRGSRCSARPRRGIRASRSMWSSSSIPIATGSCRTRRATTNACATRNLSSDRSSQPLRSRLSWPNTDHRRQLVRGVRVTIPVAASSSRSPPIAASQWRAGQCSATSPLPTRRGERSTPTPRNAILLCHAWTGDSHAVGPTDAGHPGAGWWEDVVGPGLAIDTDRWFVVCANVLGGCQGSTGPGVAAPDDGKPYGSRFPVITIRDMVRAQARLADHLGVDPLALGHRRIDGRHAGARVGDHRSRIACARSCRSPRARRRRRSRSRGERSVAGRSGSTRTGVAATTTTPTPGDGPWEGLAVARMVAQVTFRSDNVFTDRFGRELADRRYAGRHASTCGSDSRSSATSITTATSWCAASTPTAT